MLHVYFGTDTVLVRTKAYEQFAEGETTGKVGVRVDQESYAPGLFVELAEAASLFNEERIVLLDTPSSEGTFAADFIAHAEALVASPHTFIVIEGALKAPEVRQLKKSGAILEEIAGTKAARFNTFALADALARKDKKTLWLLLHGAKREGIPAEEIIGVLFWQVKAIRLAQKTASAAEAGMKDYPYKKAKAAAQNFSDTEIEALSRTLISIYHEGHLGTRDIDLALEKLLLTV